MTEHEIRSLIEHELPGRFVVQRIYPGGGEGCSAAVVDRHRPGPTQLLKILDAGFEVSEASLLASFRHPRIPALAETGVTRSGRHFLLREHLDGKPLSTADRQSVDTLRRLARSVLETLAYVHLRGVLHLDIKPANVLARPAEADWALLDFGLGSRSMGVVHGGTPFFVAPEVLWGLPADPRSDLFSLGAMLVVLCADAPQVAMERFVRRFPEVDFWAAAGLEPSDLPAPFDRFVPRLVERDIGRRFVDAQAALEELVGHTGRPSVHLLRPDPIAWYGDELPSISDVGACDLVLSGGDDEDRRALAAHAATRFGQVLRTEVAEHTVCLRRSGAEIGPIQVVIPALTAEVMAAHLERTFELPSSIAAAIARGLVDAGVFTGSALAAWLVGRAHAGRIVPDGPRWTWPEALAGQIDAALADALVVVDDATPSSVRSTAEAGAFEAAEAAYREALVGGLEPHRERALRTALAEGLLRGGAPSRAIALCHDLPAVALRARLDAGELSEASRLMEIIRDQLEPSARAYFDACLAYRHGDFVAAEAAASTLAEHRSTEAEILRAMIGVSTGRHQAVIDTFVPVLDRIDSARRPFDRLSAHAVLARALRAAGEFDAVATQHEAALAIARRLGHVRYTAAVSSNLGVLAKDRRDFVSATRHLRRARAMYEHLGDREGTLTSRANLALVRLESGDAEGARLQLESTANAMADAGLAVPPLVSAAEALACARLRRWREARSKIDALGEAADARARAMVGRVREELAAAENYTNDSRTDCEEKSEQQTMESVGDLDGRALLRSFLAVNRRLAGRGEISEALAFLLDTAVMLTGGRHGYLLLRRGDDLRLEVTSGGSRDQIKSFSRSIVNRALQTGMALTGRDAAADRDLAEMPSVRELHRGSALCVPFASSSDVEGAIFVEHPGRTGAFGDVEKGYLEVFADQAAIAVDRMLHEERLAGDLERSQRELHVVKRRLGRRSPSKMVGESAAMKALREQVTKLAQSELSVLIRGETGVGKELVARALHDESPRRGQAFVSENCSAIPAELMESELFGHCRGAFTGADEDRPGLLEVASGGTVFLDEIGDMPGNLQAKLLRALQEQRIRRVGGTEPIAIDVRVVSATHKNLDEMFESGEFREDLYYRLAAVEVAVPPLRDREGDVDALADEFLRRLNAQHRRQVALADEARTKLREYDWPGNVRELEHVMARAFLLCEQDEIVGDQVPGGLDVRRAREEDRVPEWPAIPLAEAEARTIRAVLQTTGGEKTLAAKRLGISRTALYQKLRRLTAQGL